jgi:hypothetical protein
MWRLALRVFVLVMLVMLVMLVVMVVRWYIWRWCVVRLTSIVCFPYLRLPHLPLSTLISRAGEWAWKI